MNILYLPLDERPCNSIYPIKAAEAVTDLTITSPSLSLLGKKKISGNVQALQKFMLNKSMNMDAIVLSSEMLVYGGLLPSRLHHLDKKAIDDYETTMREIKRKNENTTIYVSNLIMRTPKFSTSEEEPDYYENYGADIFRYGWLKDKNNREGLLVTEQEEFADLEEKIPVEFIKDYEERRQFNLEVNQLNILLLQEKVIDFLVIPQDDAAEYGYTAMDQKALVRVLNEASMTNVMIYPGADEVGFTLLARAYNEYKKRKPKIYPIYSSTFGPFIIPLYEDRPINETMKAHVMASGCELALSSNDADMILAYNTPGKVMQESWDQLTDKDITYSTFRHLPSFVHNIKHFIDMDKPVIVADSAYANGGDGELIQLLDYYELLDKLKSYKAWNTNGNTLGSSIAAGVFAVESKQKVVIKSNLLLHLYEDFLYQSIIRMEVTKNQLPNMGLTYFDLKEKRDAIELIVKEKMDSEKQHYMKKTFLFNEYKVSIDFPWNRMFEIFCEVTRVK